MICETIATRFPSQDAALRRHLVGCPACRTAWATYQELADLMIAAPPVAPPTAIEHARARRALLAGARLARRDARPRHRMLQIAVAASALIMGASVLHSAAQERRPPARPLLRHLPAGLGVPAAEGEAPALPAGGGLDRRDTSRGAEAVRPSPGDADRVASTRRASWQVRRAQAASAWRRRAAAASGDAAAGTADGPRAPRPAASARWPTAAGGAGGRRADGAASTTPLRRPPPARDPAPVGPRTGDEAPAGDEAPSGDEAPRDPAESGAEGVCDEAGVAAFDGCMAAAGCPPDGLGGYDFGSHDDDAIGSILDACSERAGAEYDACCVESADPWCAGNSSQPPTCADVLFATMDACLAERGVVAGEPGSDEAQNECWTLANERWSMCCAGSPDDPTCE